MAVIASGMLQACVTAKLDELRQARTGIKPGDRVVVLARRQFKAHQTEQDFTHCLDDKLAGGSKPIKVYSNQRFINTLFPWFEPGTAPLSVKDLSKLLDHPLVADKIAASGIHYLIWVDGDTETVSENGGMSCAISPLGGGCLGLGWWDKDSSYEATIWDLKRAKSVGKISTDTSGTSYLPAIVIPIPLIARTQATACDGLASQLKQFLLADKLAVKSH